MKLSSFPFQNKLNVLDGLTNRLTSELIEAGPFVSFPNNGLPYYDPIGSIVRNKIETLIENINVQSGMQRIHIPSYMKRSTLDLGEDIPSTFEEKIVKLPKPMDDFIGLTTHEVDILNWLSGDVIPVNRLPLKFYCAKEILRVSKPQKGILKLREFEVFAGISVNSDRNSLDESIREYGRTVERNFRALNLPFIKAEQIGIERKKSNGDFDLEYFYPTKEGENLKVGGNSVKALSMCMAYEFKPKNNPCKIWDPSKGFRYPFVGSYSMGLERMLYAIFDSNRDAKGFTLPPEIRPFDISILTFDEDNKTLNDAKIIYETLSKKSYSIMFDDRSKPDRTKKVRISDYLGIPKKIIASKKGVRILERSESESREYLTFEEIINRF